MADMTELERSANQYLTQHVANGGRREDVLADWIRSDNADLQKYAKGVLVKDLNPDKAAAEVAQNQQAPGSSYMDMAKDMAPIMVPAALGSAAVAGGAYYLGKKKGEGIAPPSSSDFEARRQQLELDRMQAQVETERARAARLTQMANKGQPLQTQAKFSEPTVAELAADTTSVKVPSPATNALVQSTLTAEDIQARAAQLKPVDATPQLGAPQPPQAAPEAPVAPKAPVATPLSAAPVDAPAPLPSAKPNSPVTSIVADTLKELIQETPTDMDSKPVAPPKDLLTGTGKPAFAGQGPEAVMNKSGQPKFKPDYASINDVPSGYAFVPGAQYIDTPRQNIGQAEYTKAYTARPFPTSNDLAIQESKDINKLLGRATRAEAAAAGLPPADITPGITKKTSAGTKPVRVAGTLGALMAISDLAKADTGDQRAMAGAGLLEAILPPGFMMGGAGEGSSNVPSMDAAMLLGSPYAQSQEAKKRRQEQEYIRKIGAGRGIAPPSAYQR